MRVGAADAGALAATHAHAHAAPRDLPAFMLASALLVFIATQVCAGVLRWSLDAVGLSVLTYAPTALLLACIAGVAAAHGLRGMIPIRGLLLGLLLCLGVLIALFSVPAKQAVFGLWILTPLMFGYACARPEWLTSPACRTVALSALLVAGVGVVFDQWLDYPWTGSSFELGGKSIAGSREWHIGERPRLAGLSRSSFDAAAHIAVFAVVAAIHTRTRLSRACIWALAVYAIHCTTSRGILLALAVAVAVIEAPQVLRRMTTVLATLGGLAFAVLPPVIAATVDLSQVARLQLRSSHGSFLDRMSEMWPSAYALLWSSPAPALGRGIGGIGAAQNLFEPDAFNAGDNLFVYGLVVFGLLALPIFLALARAAMSAALRIDHTPTAPMIPCLYLLVVWYGAVSNIVENPLPAAILGLLLACALQYRLPTVAPQEHFFHERKTP